MNFTAIYETSTGRIKRYGRARADLIAGAGESSINTDSIVAEDYYVSGSSLIERVDAPFVANKPAIFGNHIVIKPDNTDSLDVSGLGANSLIRMFDRDHALISEEVVTDPSKSFTFSSAGVYYITIDCPPFRHQTYKIVAEFPATTDGGLNTSDVESIVAAQIAANPSAGVTTAELNTAVTTAMSPINARVGSLETTQAAQDAQVATIGIADKGNGTFDFTNAAGVVTNYDASEVHSEAGPLAGAAPAGKKVGVDTLANKFYLVDGAGNWIAESAGITKTATAIAAGETDPPTSGDVFDALADKADQTAHDAHLADTAAHSDTIYDDTPVIANTAAITAEALTRAANDVAQDGRLDALEAHDHTLLHNPLTLKAGSAGALSGQELDIPAIPALLDEDDFASDSDTQGVTQQSAKAYIERSGPFLERIGWWKSGGKLSEVGARRLAMSAVSLTRWNKVDHEEQPFNYVAQDPISFRYYDRNGPVNTGFDGSDVSGSQDQINQGVGWDDNGVLSDITAVGGDANDGGNYPIYIIPQSGLVAVLLPQRIENNTQNAFIRMEDQFNQMVLPAELSDAVLLGVATLDEDASNFTFSMSTGPNGTLSGQASAVNKTFKYVDSEALRDALSPEEFTEGGVIGVGGTPYSEYRVLVKGNDFASSTTKQVWPGGSEIDEPFRLTAHTDLDALTIKNPGNFIVANVTNTGVDLTYTSRTLTYHKPGDSDSMLPNDTGFTLNAGERAVMSLSDTDVKALILDPVEVPVPNEWIGGTTYNQVDELIAIAPAGVTEVANALYLIRPKADNHVAAATMDSTEWALYDVVGSYTGNRVPSPFFLQFVDVTNIADGTSFHTLHPPNDYSYFADSTVFGDQFDYVTPNSIAEPAPGRWIRSGKDASDDWKRVDNGGNFKAGEVSYQKLATDTGVEPTLTEGQWFSFVRPDADGKHIYTHKYSDGTTVHTIESGASLPDVATGPAIERVVYQRNRGQTMVFGDLQFRVPSTGNSSFQMRMGSGSMTISNFITHWSHQQGGASEESFGFTLGTGWRYFRTQGLTLTQHNNFQEAMFQANGWLYHVEVIVGGSWQNNRFSFTRWRLEGIKGEDGKDAASIDHVSLTTGDSSPGTTDTYTLWADAGETTALGTYDVPIPAAVGGIQTVELASYAGAHTTGRTLTLADGRTWQNVLDEFQFVYVNVGANNLFSHDQSRQWHVSDLGVQSIDMAITDYQTHGSNSYHYKLRCPAANSTTVTIDNDGSSMSAQRIKVIGVK